MPMGAKGMVNGVSLFIHDIAPYFSPCGTNLSHFRWCGHSRCIASKARGRLHVNQMDLNPSDHHQNMC